MELVIKISEEDYHYVKKQVADGITNPLKICIANGTPLPKGHDVLIDRGELKKIIQENDPLSMRGFSVRLCDIYRATPIIEADKADVDEINDTHLSTFEVAGIVAIKNGIPFSKGINAIDQADTIIEADKESEARLHCVLTAEVETRR